MNDYGELVYQLVRFAFTGSLLLILFLLLKATIRDIEIESRDRGDGSGLAGEIAQLHILDGSGSNLRAGEVIEIRHRVVLGRAAECDIVADDPSVSTVHAAVFSNHGGWLVEDLGSTNGTYVSGKPVVGPTAIGSGEMMQIGRIRIRLLC